MSKTIKMLIIGGTIIGLMLFLLVFNNKGTMAQQITLQCGQLPEGSLLTEIKKGVYNVEGMDGQIVILEGFTTGVPSETLTDTTEIVPVCYAGVEGFKIYKGLRLIDDKGNMTPLVKGVGTDLSSDGKSNPLP